MTQWNVLHMFSLCVCVCVCVYLVSQVRLFATPWTETRQASMSLGFPKQEYWSELPFSIPGESSWPRDWTHISCRRADGFFSTAPSGKPNVYVTRLLIRHSIVLILSSHPIRSISRILSLDKPAALKSFCWNTQGRLWGYFIYLTNA